MLHLKCGSGFAITGLVIKFSRVLHAGCAPSILEAFCCSNPAYTRTVRSINDLPTIA